MPWVRELVHQPNLNQAGTAIHRRAVRGIIRRHDRLLLVYSGQVGDYKFPGGGVQDHETDHQALLREVLEEIGATITTTGQELGRVIEYSRPREHDYDLFKLTSVYYLCSVAPALGVQHLEQYEQDLGFAPRWVTFDLAIATNRALLSAGRPNLPRWVQRDTMVLELLQAQFGISSRRSTQGRRP